MPQPKTEGKTITKPQPQPRTIWGQLYESTLTMLLLRLKEVPAFYLSVEEEALCLSVIVTFCITSKSDATF